MSIVCQEDRYLKELVRYIHLNLLRAGLVKDILELNQSPWSGHSALMGKVKRKWQNSEYVLSFFGQNRYRRRNYQQYVQKGVALGRRPELVGGGLVRSLGRDDGNLFVSAPIELPASLAASIFQSVNTIRGNNLFSMQYISHYRSNMVKNVHQCFHETFLRNILPLSPINISNFILWHINLHSSNVPLTVVAQCFRKLGTEISATPARIT